VRCACGTLLADPTNASLHEAVSVCEREGDRNVSTILQRLNTTFVTPFDREDIHALAEELDDVVDDLLGAGRAVDRRDLAGLLGAISWDLITFLLGLPTSSTHAPVGDIAGAAVAKAGFDVLMSDGLRKIGVFIILSPLGGWRIVRTMGSRITRLQPVGGVAAESGAAVTLFATSAAGIPVSTTQTITGAIVGVGAARRLSAVRWGVAGRVVWAWVLTIPGAFAIAFLMSLVVQALS